MSGWADAPFADQDKATPERFARSHRRREIGHLQVERVLAWIAEALANTVRNSVDAESRHIGGCFLLPRRRLGVARLLDGGCAREDVAVAHRVVAARIACFVCRRVSSIALSLMLALVIADKTSVKACASVK